MKHLLTFLRHDVSATLASTVGSPSAHRRGTMLKHYAFMLLFLLGSLNVWATEELYYTLTPANGTNNSYAGSCDIAISGITWNLEGNSQVQPWKLGANNKTALSKTNKSIYSKTAIDENITKIEITHGASSNITVNSMTVIVSKNSDFTSPESTLTPTFAASSTVTVNRPEGKDWSNCYYKITYNLTGAKSSANSIQFSEAKFYHEVGGEGGSSNPTGSMTPDPASVDVTAEGDDNGSISITYEGITDKTNIDDVKIYSDAEHTVEVTNTIDWLIADWNADKTAVEYVVAANTGAERTAYIYLYALDDEANSVEVVIPVTQAKYAAPTGTFELFSGDLVEGDYVICSGTTALKNAPATNTNYIGYESITVSNDEIENPSENLVWHIAQSGEYWTIHNVAANKYAASTGAKNKGQVIDDGTDDKALWTASGTSSYEFVNKANTAASVNSNLRYNNGYGFACYGTGTGAALTLYKLSDGKEVAGLAYDAADAQKLAKVAGTLTAPILTNPNSLTIVYASSNTDVVEVNASTGAITAIKAAGKAEITASFAGNDTYQTGSAKYTIYVAEQAGTAEDPLTEASAKDLINLGCTLRAHVKGTVATVGNLNTTYGNITLTLTDGLQFYGMLNIGGSQFTENPFVIGDVVTAVGNLKKYNNTTYELDVNCQLVEREAYTAPKVDISNTAENAYTPAQAIALYNDVTSDLTKEVYVKGVVVATPALKYNESLTDDAAVYNGTYNVYVKAEDDNSENPTTFEFYRMFADGENATFENGDIQVGELIVAKGTLSKYNSTYEFAQGCKMVSKKSKATMTFDNLEMVVNDEETLAPKTITLATAEAVTYAIKEGSDDCITLANGVVTATDEGTATIVATVATVEAYIGTSVEFTVTVSAAADTRKVANSPDKFTTTNGDLDPTDIAFEAFKGDASTAPANYNDGIRLYQASSEDAIGGFITLKAKKGCTIDQVKITTTDTYATTVAYSVDGNEHLLGSGSVAKSGDYSTPSGLNVESVNIVNKGSDKNSRLEIASIKVWYTGDALAVDHYFLGGTYETTFEQNGTFNYTGLEVYAAYDAGETITEPVEGFTVEADLSTAGEKKAEVYLNEVKIAEYNITVTAGKEDPALAYSPVSETITAGDAWSAPTLSNIFHVTPITYSSDKESVATVTSEGVITLAGGYGTAVITAHFDESAAYIESEATYTITVNKPAATPTSTVYRKVTATADITDGEYLIVYEGDTKHDAAVFDGSLDDVDQAKKALPVEIVNNEIAGNTDLDAAVFTIDVTAGTLQSASGWYIGRTANSNGLDKSTTEAYANTFAITNGAAVITSSAGPTLRYNYASDQLRFRYYTSGQQAIQLYKKETATPPTPVLTEVRTGLTAGNYYTMCLEKAVTDVRGGSIWRVLSKAQNTSDIILEEVDGTLDAGRPYIFFATADKLEVVYEGAALGTPIITGNNGLVGSFEKKLIAQAATNYIIYNNALYFVNSDNVYVGAHRAYLDMTGVPPYSNEPQQGNAPRRRVTMAVHGEQVATGMENVQGDNVQCTKVLINGQLFIIRGEKMYDATGRLVK